MQRRGVPDPEHVLRGLAELRQPGFGLPELLRRDVPVGDVAADAEPFGDLAIGSEQRHGAGQDPADAAVGEEDPVLKLEQGFGADRLPDRGEDLRPVLVEDVIVHPILAVALHVEIIDAREGELLAEHPHRHPPDLAGVVDRPERIAQPQQHRLPPLAVPQRLLDALARADILEQDRDLVRLRRADAEGMDPEPAAEGRGLMLEMLGRTGSRDPPVGVDPILLEIGTKRPHALADHGREAGLRLEGGIHLDEDIVDRPARPVELHPDDAEADVDGVQQGPVALRLGIGRRWPRLSHWRRDARPRGSDADNWG